MKCPAPPRPSGIRPAWTRILGLISLGFLLRLPAGPAPFTLRQADNRWWFVAPSGERFFSAGVGVVTRGVGRPEWDPENPAYASWRHYPDDAAWARATTARLAEWQFTTLGGWADYAAL